VLREILLAGVERVDAGRVVRDGLSLVGETLRIADQSYALNDFERIVLLGMGKASAAMAETVLAILGDRIADGLVVTARGAGLDMHGVRVIEAGHPIPDEDGLAGARELAELAASCGERDLALVLLSGGASALAPLPAEGVGLDDKQRAASLLLRAGAAIHEVNAVRKHLSAIKGGGLARMLAPATSATLIISDVVGDRLDVIGSGPTVADSSTFADALDVVERYSLGGEMPEAVMVRLRRGAAGEVPETIKPGDAVLKRTQPFICAGNALALEACAEAARSRGYTPMVLSDRLQGEAREVARALVAVAQRVAAADEPVPKPACVLAGGETTVTVRGEGKGGRNQELVLASLAALAEDPALGERIAAGSLGTDGIDGPTDAAGAVANLDALEATGLRQARTRLADNDAYGFFKEAGGLVRTGPTRTNVMDVVGYLVE
jgi:hydroxypyruvate reductase